MESNEKPCRHEYVKIFQRKYKDFARRLVSTRGYLPTGFSNKDFTFLTGRAYCFCTKCRKRLFPNRIEAVKIDAIASPIPVVSIQPPEQVDTIWTEESSTINAAASPEIDIEELQIEPVEISDLLDTSISVNVKEDAEEEGEE